jgi:hypothetical protein
MKNILLLSLSLFALNITAQVSCVIDTTNTVQGATPTADLLPCAERGKYYEQVVQLLMPTSFSLATIDSFKILTVSGVPNGMQYVSNPASMVFVGGKNGCFVISGTTNDPKGYYNIGFTGIAYIKVAGNNQTFPLSEDDARGAGFDLFIEIVEPGDTCRQPIASGINTINQFADLAFNTFVSSQNNQVMVQVKTADVFSGKVFMVNMLGATVASKSIEVNGNTTDVLDVAGVAKGMYSVVLQSDNKVVSRKVMIK